MYKILSLDGGGSWSIIQVMCLQNIYGEHAKGFDILRRFDLAVANSGGSLVLAAMCMNLPLSEIFEILDNESKRKQVFTRLPFFRRMLSNLGLGIGPKYSASQKRIGLRALLGPNSETAVEDVPDLLWPDGSKKTHILICGFDYDKQRVQFFRSNIESKADSAVKAGNLVNQLGSYMLLDAIHSASNAPINYFDKPAIVNIGGMRERYWDGAVAGFNNPILAGITEAVANDAILADIQVFSIGTGNSLLPLQRHFENEAKEKPHFFALSKPSKLKDDVKKMAFSILSDPPDSASFIAHTLVRGANKTNGFPVLRLNPLISPKYENGEWVRWPGFGNDGEFKAVLSMDMDAVEREEVDLIKQFAEAWLNDRVMNQPISTDKELKVIIDKKSGFPMGFDLFSAAKKEWATRDIVPA